MDLEIDAKSVEIKANYQKRVSLIIDDADLDFIKDIPADKIVDIIDNNKLLEALDLEYIKEKFNLKEIE